MRHPPLLPLTLLLGFGLAGCSAPGKPVDLRRVAEAGGLVEASVAGRPKTWVLRQMGRDVRLNDIVYRALPASPPSRLVFHLDIPRGGRLDLACAIGPRFQKEPGVEFVVKVGTGEQEQTLWSSLLDPISHPEHRLWVPARVDLAKFAGRDRTLVLETRGYGSGDAVRRAYWGAPAVTAPSKAAPLAIIYLVDTLRADHTTPYGYHRNTTPELQKLTKDAVVFDTAIAQASWTKPSVASIFTSLLPGRHRAVQLRDSLDPGLVTLAEMLDARRVASGAAIANSVIYSDGTNFDQGFDYFAGLHGAGNRPSKLVDSAEVVDTALAWLDRRRGLPSFLYVHTMDPHVPYEPPPPYDGMFEPHPAPGHPGVDPRTDFKEPEDRDRLMAQYDGAIAYGDKEFGRFIQGLKDRGLYDRALIVFMADHGEEFQDHGGWLHGRSVFDELIHIPLVIKFPEQVNAGTRVAQQVQEIDILPTILHYMGLPVPPPPVISGQALQGVVAGGAPEPPAISEISHRGFVAAGMRTRKDKYIHRFSPDEDELYFDLVKDPKEQHNLLDQFPARVRSLKAGVEAAMVPNPFRNLLRVTGAGEYQLKLRTGGWIMGVEARGLQGGESADVEGNGRKLLLHLKPGPGAPREVAFSVRPMGAPVWLDGTRDGRALRRTDVLIAREAVHPRGIPCRLPEIESESDRVDNIFVPPSENRLGIQLWLVMSSGRKVMNFDDATRQRLKALGYLN